MEKRVLDSIDSCNTLLKTNGFWANGKNFQVDILYATSASSRWPYENIWGIYLAKPHFAWMALWMAVTSRTRLKKRQIRYFFPDMANGDYIGQVGIFNPELLELKDIVCEKAYLYLFDQKYFPNLRKIDISGKEDENKKAEALIKYGFEQKTVFRRGKNYNNAYVFSTSDPVIVDIDDWQIALVNIEEITPNIEITITNKLITELSGRIQWLNEEVGENYITYIP